MKLTADLDLVPVLRQGGAIPPFRNTSSCRGSYLKINVLMEWCLVKHKDTLPVHLPYGIEISSSIKSRQICRLAKRSGI